MESNIEFRSVSANNRINIGTKNYDNTMKISNNFICNNAINKVININKNIFLGARANLWK